METLLSVAIANVHPTDCAGSEREVLLVLPALYCIYCLWISVIRFLAIFIDFPFSAVTFEGYVV